MYNWERLIIKIEDLDCDELLRQWRWMVPHLYTPLFITAFGDWMLASPEKEIYFLDLMEGTLEKVADSEDEFSMLLENPENIAKWFSEAWVRASEESGILLEQGDCLGWKIAPAVGGKFSLENIQVYYLGVYQSLMGQFHYDLQNRPVQTAELAEQAS